jgi:hypothetical protein
VSRARGADDDTSDANDAAGGAAGTRGRGSPAGRPLRLS